MAITMCFDHQFTKDYIILKYSEVKNVVKFCCHYGTNCEFVLHLPLTGGEEKRGREKFAQVDISQKWTFNKVDISLKCTSYKTRHFTEVDISVEWTFHKSEHFTKIDVSLMGTFH